MLDGRRSVEEALFNDRDNGIGGPKNRTSPLNGDLELQVLRFFGEGFSNAPCENHFVAINGHRERVGVPCSRGQSDGMDERKTDGKIGFVVDGRHFEFHNLDVIVANSPDRLRDRGEDLLSSDLVTNQDFTPL